MDRVDPLNEEESLRWELDRIRERIKQITAQRIRQGKRIGELEDQLDQVKTALKLIKNGGVPDGVNATAEERMLEMCRIATEALKELGDQ